LALAARFVTHPTRAWALCVSDKGAAAPVIAVVLLIAGNLRIMGRLTLRLPMLIGGWIAALVMLAASIGFFVL
jgi:hypothetical protein